MINHHVSDELLYLYAGGALARGWSLAVATHLALCPICRAKAAEYEAAQSSDLVAVAPADMSTSAEDLLSFLGEQEHEMIPAPQPETAVIPRPLRDFSGDVDDIKWSFVGGGVRQSNLFEEDGVSARILYIPPSTAVPAHGHGGLELTQVVSGGFFDGDVGCSRGDIQIVAHDSPHQPIAMSDQPCVCLAVTDAPLKFSNILPRLFQPLFKI